jgi:hypothetical protein
MLGKDKLLTHGLEAKALVLDKRAYAVGVQTNEVTACSYTLLVKFQDGSEAEISRRVFHRELAGAAVGSLIPVRYDPKDKSKVEIDGAAIKAAQEAQANELREQALERGRARLEGRDPASRYPVHGRADDGEGGRRLGHPLRPVRDERRDHARQGDR